MSFVKDFLGSLILGLQFYVRIFIRETFNLKKKTMTILVVLYHHHHVSCPSRSKACLLSQSENVLSIQDACFSNCGVCNVSGIMGPLSA